MPPRPVDRTSENRRQQPRAPEKQRPSFYDVVLYDDPVTPHHFVIRALERFFGLSEFDASELVGYARELGSRVIGQYPFEIAETKVHYVNEFARENGYPLFLALREA